MKMYKSVFEFPNYGLEEFYKKKAEAKEVLAKRKGKTKATRKELKARANKENLEKTIKLIRKVEAQVIATSNKSVPEDQRKKHNKKKSN